MLTYNRIIRHRQAFKNLTGLSVNEFNELYARIELAWQQAEIARLSRPYRQRAIGGGAHYVHSIAQPIRLGDAVDHKPGNSDYTGITA